MENAAVANVLRGEGYRYCHTNLAEAGIYYKYYQEGFHIVMAVDLSGGNRFSVQQYRSMEEHAMDLFYHPQGRLGDFPDGFPVYHVEMLTLLIGGDSEVERKLCAECRNVWVYQPQSGRLLIYENQPGDFFDLRRALEQGVGGGGTVAKYIAKMNIDTVDIGVPVISMHSPYEVISKADLYELYLAVRAFVK